MDSFYRYYLAEKVHPLEGEVLKQALESFEGAALKFSVDFIQDAGQRENYNRNVQRVKADVLAEVKAGRVSVKEAAEHCYEMRNKIMTEIRTKTSLQGRAVAESRKKVSRALEELLNEKASNKFGKKFLDLDGQQRSLVHYDIIESSARPSAGYNTTNKILRVTGKVLIVVTIAYAAYDIAGAENKTKETIKQGAAIGGGLLGTFIGGGAAIALCAGGAPVCTIALLLAGGASGGWLASKGVDLYDDELEEFTRWGVR